MTWFKEMPWPINNDQQHWNAEALNFQLNLSNKQLFRKILILSMISFYNG